MLLLTHYTPSWGSSLHALGLLLEVVASFPTIHTLTLLSLFAVYTASDESEGVEQLGARL